MQSFVKAICCSAADTIHDAEQRKAVSALLLSDSKDTKCCSRRTVSSGLMAEAECVRDPEPARRKQ